MYNKQVIFRKDKKSGEIIAFFPSMYCRIGIIDFYAHNGQHGTAKMDYYKNGTKRATEDEYSDLLKEIKQIYGDVNIVVKKRLF